MVENPYDVPGGALGEAGDPIEDMATSGIVKAAAILEILAGLFLVLAGAQLLLAVEFVDDKWKIVPFLQLAVGLGLMVCGAKVYRTRGWAAIGGAVGAGVGALGMGIWALISLAGGLFSVIGLLTPLLALAAAIVGALAVGPCLRADRARKRLMSEPGF